MSINFQINAVYNNSFAMDWFLPLPHFSASMTKTWMHADVKGNPLHLCIDFVILTSEMANPLPAFTQYEYGVLPVVVSHLKAKYWET